MLSIFKDSIRTPKQRARYFWAKRIAALGCAIASASYAGPYLGQWSLLVGLAALVLSYVTIAPVVAAIVCLLEEIASL